MYILHTGHKVERSQPSVHVLITAIIIKTIRIEKKIYMYDQRFMAQYADGGNMAYLRAFMHA